MCSSLMASSLPFIMGAFMYGDSHAKMVGNVVHGSSFHKYPQLMLTKCFWVCCRQGHLLHGSGGSVHRGLHLHCARCLGPVSRYDHSASPLRLAVLLAVQHNNCCPAIPTVHMAAQRWLLVQNLCRSSLTVAAGACFCSGCRRTKFIELIPRSVMLSTSAGIGLFLAFIGLQVGWPCLAASSHPYMPLLAPTHLLPALLSPSPAADATCTRLPYMRRPPQFLAGVP